MVHALISSYGLLDSMKVVSPTVASVEDIKLCHSQYYIEYLLGNCQDSGGTQNNTSLCPDEDSDSDEVDDEQLNYGLGAFLVASWNPHNILDRFQDMTAQNYGTSGDS